MVRRNITSICRSANLFFGFPLFWTFWGGNIYSFNFFTTYKCHLVKFGHRETRYIMTVTDSQKQSHASSVLTVTLPGVFWSWMWHASLRRTRQWTADVARCTGRGGSLCDWNDVCVYERTNVTSRISRWAVVTETIGMTRTRSGLPGYCLCRYGPTVQTRPASPTSLDSKLFPGYRSSESVLSVFYIQTADTSPFSLF